MNAWLSFVCVSCWWKKGWCILWAPEIQGVVGCSNGSFEKCALDLSSDLRNSLAQWNLGFFVGLGTKMSRFQYCYSLGRLHFWGRWVGQMGSESWVNYMSFFRIPRLWILDLSWCLSHPTWSINFWNIIIIIILLFIIFSGLTHKYEKN
jgi:hypothetical protein